MTAAAVGAENVFVPAAGILYALAVKDGRESWKFRMSDPLASAPAVVDINGDGAEDAIGVCQNGIIYAVNGRDGHTIWEYKYLPTRTLTQNRIVLTGKDSTVGVLATASGDVMCLDLKKGQPIWKAALKEPILSAPAMVQLREGKMPDIVVGTMGRRVHGLSGKDGRRLWCYEVGGQIRYSVPLPVTISTNPAPVIFIGTGPPENGLYCLSASAPRPKDRGWLSPWKDAMTVSK
jgi:outer membrane protein assembly factor BamB